MKYINNDHRYLSKSQTSSFMERLTGMSFDKRISIISTALVSGVTAIAMAWHGTSSGRIYFCFESPKGDICADKNNRPFRMTPSHWKQWGLDGRPDYIVRRRYELPTNPGKPFQAGWGFLSFAVAGWMFRQLNYAENQKSRWDVIAQTRDTAIAEMNNQIDLMEVVRELELTANDNAVIIQQAELLSEVELKLTQMETAEMIFEAETAGMTEQRRQDYIQFLRSQNTPYLQGSQTLEKTVSPKDKVEGEGYRNVIAPDSVSEIIQRLSREDGSIAICGDPGTGKSTITREYISQIRRNYPNAEIRVLAIKNDSFSGLREQGKVTCLIGSDWLDKAKAFFQYITQNYEVRLKLPENQRDKLSPFVIILDDWLIISAKLKKIPDLPFDFGQVLFDLLIIGREYNMKFFVNLHSLNLSAIGIKELDQNTRKCLRLILLGNRYQKDGREIDAYGVIEYALSSNQVITNIKDKEVIRDKYLEVKSQSRAEYRPVMFAFVGEYFLGLVPKLSYPDSSIQTVDHLIDDVWESEPEGRTVESYIQQCLQPKPEPEAEPLNPISSNTYSQNPNQFYTPLKLSREQAISMISYLRTELTQTEVIERLWQCRKGGSAVWREAYSQFRTLMEENGNDMESSS